MPSFAEYAIGELKKNPEVIAALEEFERTKKLPKLTYRKRIDVTIDENVLREFKKHCQEKGMSISRAVEKAIKKALAETTV